MNPCKPQVYYIKVGCIIRERRLTERLEHMAVVFKSQFRIPLGPRQENSHCEPSSEWLPDRRMDPVGHYENTPMQYTAIFHGCKNAIFQLNLFYYFHIFAQNIHCGYTLEAVITSTHNICFRAKLRK